MPLTLGLGAAGKAASSLAGSGKAGPTSTMTQNGTNSNASSATQSSGNTQTPNLNPLMAGFQASLVPALSSMYAKAQQPVYGAQQIAQVANQGDQATDAAGKAVDSALARNGALNSGVNAAAQTQLAQGNESNTVGFENQVPLLNYQNEMAQTGNVLGLAEGLTGKALSTSTGTSSGLGSSNSLTNTNSTTSATGPAFGAGMLGQTGGILSNAAANGGGGKGGGKGVSAGSPSTIAGGAPGISGLGDLLGGA